MSANLVTEDQKGELMKLLRYKLSKTHIALMPDITIDEILTATDENGGNWPFPDDANVPYGATLQGILHYRVKNAIYAMQKRPINECDPDALLSYFRSNYDPNMSFNRFFRQTRLRCYMAFSAKQKGKATKVQLAYIFACLEEMGYGTFMDPKNPCAAREAFVAELIKNPKDFKAYGKTTTMLYLAKISQQMSDFRRRNMNGVIQCLFTSFVDEDGTDLGNEHTAPGREYIPMKDKRRKRGRKHKHSATTADDDDNAMDIDSPAPNTFTDTPITEHVVIDGRPLAGLRKDHPILDKLMEWYPGYVCIGEEEHKGPKCDPDALINHRSFEDDGAVDALSDSLAAVEMSDNDILRYLRDDWFVISKHHQTQGFE
ncbi:hypothetical protein DM02DRAFT_670580 [Periconia macrospinosa]|uniref:Uncharacterized protein n=1 Tax=Periconia macrospinosa TaxID=97972 RepID=A0A2V1DWE9_9PLEO|nr:hypothetical protein DM02DRAFT_670580 [Periconia macrospinosa]